MAVEQNLQIKHQALSVPGKYIAVSKWTALNANTRCHESPVGL